MKLINKKEEKKMNILTKVVMIIVFVVMVIVFVIMRFNLKYEYVCFNRDMQKDEVVFESYLDICTTRKELPQGVVINKSELISDVEHTYYKLEKDIYKKGDMLYKKDFTIYEEEKVEEKVLTLLKEATFKTDEGKTILNEEDFITYHVFVDENVLYAVNEDNNEKRVIFDKENVKNIAIMPICCAGDGNLLILTEYGNVYISEKDCNYSFSFDFPFKKLDVSDIVSFKLVPTDEYSYYNMDLYGINSKNEEVLIQK